MIELCSESKGIIFVENFSALINKFLPNEIKHSLLAKPIVFPEFTNLLIKSIAFNPEIAKIIYRFTGYNFIKFIN